MVKEITPEERQAMQERVDAKKAEWEKRREKFKGKAMKLSVEVLEGINLVEEAYVKLVNSEYGAVDIRPLAEGEMMALIAEVGLDSIEALGDKDFQIEDYDFFWSIVSISTGLPKELIKKTFAVGESATLANRILELSGFGTETETEIEDF